MQEEKDHHEHNNTHLNPTGTLLSTPRGQISAQLQQNIHSIEMWLSDKQLRPSTTHFQCVHASVCVCVGGGMRAQTPESVFGASGFLRVCLQFAFSAVRPQEQDYY